MNAHGPFSSAKRTALFGVYVCYIQNHDNSKFANPHGQERSGG
jgi:hypothetical protein